MSSSAVERLVANEVTRVRISARALSLDILKKEKFVKAKTLGLAHFKIYSLIQKQEYILRRGSLFISNPSNYESDKF